jgi:LPPG:FO 2-phospho-L-lactate transferase
MKIVALAGGVGGAKLAQGLVNVLRPDQLSIIVNTGDDFELFGLSISPDIDTVCYTLAGKANYSTGWGIADDTFCVMEMIKKLNGPYWFRLGDQDIATHLIRTQKIRDGEKLTQITRDFCKLWGIEQSILPMSDDLMTTMVDTKEKGLIPFQEYFVKFRSELSVKGFWFKGIDTAKPTEEVMNALDSCDAVIICPSNPFVSIDPILALHGIKEIIRKKYVVGVSPIIGGRAIKGPLAKMFSSMAIEPSVNAVADHYSEIINCLFIDNEDHNNLDVNDHSGIIFKETNILIPDFKSRTRLAAEVIEFLHTSKNIH